MDACKFPERATVPPAPASVNGPDKSVDGPATKFKSPVCVIVQGPPFVEIKEPLIEKRVPVREIPETPVVSSVVVPVKRIGFAKEILALQPPRLHKLPVPA